MPELPTGTVTFLFSDIEGSTRLLAGQPDRYGALLADHHRLLRGAFGEHGGREVGTEGDAFFVAFARASDALAAAVAAQRALARDGSGVRVRIGVHTGEAALQDGDYVGLDVHRAARIAAAGHGGQVLVSGATHALVQDELPPDVGLRDLGEHRLKDLDRPEHLFQVVTGDLQAEFPPPASLSPGRARIPAPPTATVGRDADLARLAALVREPGSRLVTVVGPGGVGKTRLAVELARAAGGAFADGAYLVPLAPVRAHAHVAATVARQLDVVLLPGEAVEAGLARHLAGRDVLVVLDNFEHVLDAAPLISDLLAATSRMRVVITSREPLRLQAERVFRLDPLPAAGAAVELFASVARAREAGFVVDASNGAAVAQVCGRLDGLPLAIELAAARIGVLTVPELADRLHDGLAALGSGARDAPERQRTLTATLQWSYDLLSADEQDALAGLAVFAGGCTVDAAQAVTGASLDVLEALVAKNLVVHRAVDGHASRLHLLETVAAFARQRLAERGTGPHERHLDHYLDVALRAAPELERSDAVDLLAALDLEVHNVRAALAWALDHGAVLPALRLLSALQEYWDKRDLEREAAGWLHAAFALPQRDVPASTRAAALVTLAFALASPDTVERAVAAAGEAIAIARSTGDGRLHAAAAMALASVELSVHRVDDVYRHATEAEALARAVGDEPKRVRATQLMALTAPTLERALELGERVAAGHRRAGAERRLAGFQTSLTYTALYFADYVAAARIDAEALALAEQVGDPRALSFACGNHGLVTVLTGAAEEAGRAFAQELDVAARYGYHRLLFEAIDGLAAVAAAQGEDELAARLRGAAETTGPDRHDPVIARQLDARVFGPARARLGEQAWRRAHAEGAALTLDEAVDLARRAPVAAAGGTLEA